MKNHRGAIRRVPGILLMVCAIAILFTSCARSSDRGRPRPQQFTVLGIVKEVKPAQRSIVVDHETIPNYMDAMTMPFNVRDTATLTNLSVGDQISFRLIVTETNSWIQDIVKLREGGVPPPPPSQPQTNITSGNATSPSQHPLRDYKFTNELGHPVSLSGFQGKALAITFIFTRCPIPDFCPRLSKNFQEASRQLLALPNAPTNWHLLSVTIDPEHDAPAVLKQYAQRYNYNSRHWTFLTGPKEKIAELARESDVTYDWQGNFLNHNFRTLIIDPTGRLQMAFPVSGDISSGIVEELLKAATNSPPAATQVGPRTSPSAVQEGSP